jgi:dimeric dUTPase (all-alpha-NTP-PPase superfamily)
VKYKTLKFHSLDGSSEIIVVTTEFPDLVHYATSVPLTYVYLKGGAVLQVSDHPSQIKRQWNDTKENIL